MSPDVPASLPNTSRNHKSPSNEILLTDANLRALRRLHREWLIAASIAVFSLLVGYYALERTTYASAPSAERWFFFSSIVSAIVLMLLWRVLPTNHRPGLPELFTSIGIGNWLTFFAGMLIAWLAGFLLSPWPTGMLAWVPGILYLASRFVDLFDGIFARLFDQVTDAGANLDVEFDGLGLLIAVVLSVLYGQLPAWYLLLAVSRQLFVAGIWWRRRKGKPVYELPPSENRRITAGCQTSFVAVSLWPIVAPPATTLAAVLFSIPLVASFGRDWFVVSGAVDAESPVYVRLRRRGKQVIERWLPLAARVAGTATGAIILVRAAPAFTAWEAYLFPLGLQSQSASVLAVAAVFAIALVPFALGVVGRLAAALLIAMAALDIMATGMQWYLNAPLMVCAFVIFHFGSGCCSLWQPEEGLLGKKLDHGDAE